MRPHLGVSNSTNSRYFSKTYSETSLIRSFWFPRKSSELTKRPDYWNILLLPIDIVHYTVSGRYFLILNYFLALKNAHASWNEYRTSGYLRVMFFCIFYDFDILAHKAESGSTRKKPDERYVKSRTGVCKSKLVRF